MLNQGQKLPILEIPISDVEKTDQLKPRMGEANNYCKLIFCNVRV